VLPTATVYQIIARMDRVKNVPIVSKEIAEDMLEAYAEIKSGGLK